MNKKFRDLEIGKQFYFPGQATKKRYDEGFKTYKVDTYKWVLFKPDGEFSESWRLASNPEIFEGDEQIEITDEVIQKVNGFIQNTIQERKKRRYG